MEIKEEKAIGFSWVDWLLVGLLTAALSLGGVFLYRRVNGTAKQSVLVEYELLIANVEESLYTEATLPIVGGARVYSENGTTYLGEVASVSIRPHLAAVLYNDEMRMEEVAGRVDLLLTVCAYGEDRGNEGIRVNDIRIAAGSFCTLRIGQALAPRAEILWVKKEGMQ